jgi:hypothetical protein
MAMPRTISSARSRISRSSQVMNGSHSAPLMTSCPSAPPAPGQLGVARKDGAAEADDAGIAQDFAHTLGRQAAVIERRAGDPLVAAVRLDDHAQRRQARGMRGTCCSMASTVPEVGACTAADIQPSAPPISCPLSTVLAGLDQRIRRTADALVQRHVQARRQRRLADRLLHRRRLVGLRLDAALEAEQLLPAFRRLRPRA